MTALDTLLDSRLEPAENIEEAACEPANPVSETMEIEPAEDIKEEPMTALDTLITLLDSSIESE